MNANEKRTWSELVSLVSLWPGSPLNVRITGERKRAILAIDIALMEAVRRAETAERRAADAEAELGRTEWSKIVWYRKAAEQCRQRNAARRWASRWKRAAKKWREVGGFRIAAWMWKRSAERERIRAEAAEAALAAVTDAARVLMRRLAEVNLQQSNAKALGGALQYGPEVRALQDALEGMPNSAVTKGRQLHMMPRWGIAAEDVQARIEAIHAEKELSALRAVAEAGYKALETGEDGDYLMLARKLAALDTARTKEQRNDI
jgi:hypothetical protein